MSEQSFPLHPSERGYKSDKELLAEAAAFLDEMAGRIDALWGYTKPKEGLAAECRTMAKKLRALEPRP